MLFPRAPAPYVPALSLGELRCLGSRRVGFFILPKAVRERVYFLHDGQRVLFNTLRIHRLSATRDTCAQAR